MSKVMGAFGLLVFTMFTASILKLINCSYFSSFSGQDKPRMLNQWIRGHGRSLISVTVSQQYVSCVQLLLVVGRTGL
jgi:hypothetical protein